MWLAWMWRRMVESLFAIEADEIINKTKLYLTLLIITS